MHSATQPDASTIAAALAAVLKSYGRERLELEFRLGQRLCGKFVPGLTEACWQRLKAKLDASTAFECTASETRELIPGGDGAKYVVPQAVAPQAVAPQAAAAKAFWMHKQRLHDFDVDVADGPWTCRTSMSLEVVDPPEAQAPPPAGCKFERHKRRWSYVHRCWSVDLTKVVSNLPHQLDHDGVSYEVEIELADSAELFTRPVPELLEWGLRLAADMCGLAAA